MIAYQVLGVQPAPVDWEGARPIVRGYLTRQAGQRAVEADMQHWRRSVRIDYLGDFATLMRATAPAQE